MSHEIVPVDPIHDDDEVDIFNSPPSRHQTDKFSENSSIPFTRSLTSGGKNVAEPFDGELLLSPTFASEIQRFLRVADLIEADEPRVAYLCRFQAFDIIASNRDRNSSDKTSLLRKLEQDEEATISKRKEVSDLRELKRVYRTYTDYITTSGGQSHFDDCHINARRIASVLFEVLRNITTGVRPQEADKNKSGTADHSTSRNYDDPNEYSWSDFFCVSPDNHKVKKDVVKEKREGEEKEDEEQGVNHVAHRSTCLQIK